MKNLLALLPIVLLAISTYAQDFRQASWGDSMDKIKALESSVAPTDWVEHEGDIFNVLGFMSTVNGLDALVAFLFVDDQLVRGNYKFMEKHTNKNDFISDFNDINAALEDKYGKQEVDKMWKDDLYKDDYSDYGFAISLGHYAIACSWTIGEETTITHMVSGENYKITHVLEYNSIKLSSLIEQKNKRKLNNVL